MLTDIFAIVDLNTNRLLEFNKASLIDYNDVFRYKSIFQYMTSNQGLCVSEGLNPFSDSCPNEDRSFTLEFELTDQDRSVNLGNFDENKNKGLPSTYNLVNGWWVDREKEIRNSLDAHRLAELSIDIKSNGPVQNSITEFEALTVLQGEQLDLFSGISRTDQLNNLKERKLNLDFRISDWNRRIFLNWQPSYVDIKAPLDPEVMRARGQAYQSLEDQVDNLLTTIASQRERAIASNESVVHVINLLRIKPSDRTYFINNFRRKAALQNLDTNCVAFINISSDTI